MARLLSVVIPAFNDPDALSRCLEALTASRSQPLETIVVDDGSTIDLHSIADRFGARLIRVNAGPCGPAHARNVGAAAATGAIVVFVDADVVVRPDTLSRFADAFESHPDVAAVFGSYDDEPATPGFVSQFKNLFHHFVHQQANTEAGTFWSGCGAIRRDVFLAEGGFDDRRYPKPSIEDIELGYRLREAGHRIILKKDIQVKHLKRWTLGGLIHTDIFDRGMPWTMLMLERRKVPNDLNLRFAQRLSAVVAYSMMAYAILAVALPDALPLTTPLFGAAAVIVLLNYRLYAFFARKRGAVFALAALPMQLLYYSYALVGLGLGVTAFLTHGRRSRVPAGA